MPAPPADLTPPTLAEILAACLAVQAIYAARDAAAAAQDGPPARQADAGAAIGATAEGWGGAPVPRTP
jgi:cell pole-organizing protein PopZ